MDKPKLRASYTYLKMWRDGNWQGAINAYFKLEKYTNRGMAEGLEFHEEWEKETRLNKALPAVFGGAPLQNPILEQKLVIPVFDWMDLVVKIDCYDKPIIHEYKTGVMTSADYASTKQPAVYAVGLTLLKQYVKAVDIHAYNQHNKTTSFSRVWVTDKMLSEGFDWIETVASEMYSYFVENKLWELYGKKEG